jgi:endonuclease/exonuclease/phosphatase family metal-dependent hydrolase
LNRILAKPYKYSSVSVTKFYRPRAGDPFREGLAVLSRFPIVRTESLALYQAEDDKHVRTIQNVDLDSRDEEIKISNVHFSNNAHSMEQLRETLSIFDTRGEERIVVGDFNIFELGESRADYGEKYSSSVDFSKYISYPSQGQTLDYVLLPLKYTFSSVDVLEGLSDHNALIVDYS